MSEESESEERIDIMTLGNQGVGKTNFILRYTENIYQETYLNTIGIDFKTKNIIINENQYKLFFYDTAGQEKFKSISLNIVKNTQGIILMYDITDKSSFLAIPDWIESIREIKEKNFPMILCGNKIDLEDKRIVSKEEGKKLADEYQIEFFETSNKDEININEAGICIVNKILDKRSKDNLSVEVNRSNSTSKLSSRTTRTEQAEDSMKCCRS